LGHLAALDYQNRFQHESCFIRQDDIYFRDCVDILNCCDFDINNIFVSGMEGERGQWTEGRMERGGEGGTEGGCEGGRESSPKEWSPREGGMVSSFEQCS
jgi:hypothetical protein